MQGNSNAEGVEMTQAAAVSPAPATNSETPSVNPSPQPSSPSLRPAAQPCAEKSESPLCSDAQSSSAVDVRDPESGIDKMAAAEAAEAARRQRKKAKKRVWRKSGVIPLLFAGFMSAFACIVCALYLSPVYDPLVKIKDLPVGIINNDVLPPLLKALNVHTSLGDLVTSTILSNAQTKHMYDWRLHPNMTYEEAHRRVKEDKVFAYLYFPPNYTATFLMHYMGKVPGAPRCSYVNPIVVILDETKQYTTSRVLATALNITFRTFSNNVAQMIMMGFVKSGNQTYKLPPLNTTVATYGMRVEPIYATYDSPRHIDHYGWYFIAYISFVVVWLTMLVATNITSITFQRKMNAKVELKFWQVCLLRLATLVWIAFITSLVLAGIVSNSYDYPMYHGYGGLFGTFLLASLSMGGIVALLYAWLDQGGMVASIFLLILQITTCDGIYSVWTLPHGFRGVSQILPMYHAAHLQRRAAFDTLHEGLAKHILVQLAWMIGGFGLAVVGWYFEAGQKVMHKILPPKVEGVYYIAEVEAEKKAK
eukprot:m51a1_g3586 hypothetical protein (534) ;mRNA; f:1148676-1150533